ncbi:hypothetical protein BCV69DRAFT_113016 [Microstroma glucosiphilum]|uniref:Uncharacterized protein n=1 Tax=Pseudomicrostroma glucosiphilum TaxID=1684307 RepID=A0A316UH34_9BASI|nr:hypothetical protein BCV69DRAFT_113016 [Pseudomicrostroma glucosiphilum]PWN23243.1 hypothetical protein BCV69DRAFT_113016 [Pseudomicrostroma glucosiphilum]
MLATMRPAPLQQPQHAPHYNSSGIATPHSRPLSRAGSSSSARSSAKEPKTKRNTSRATGSEPASSASTNSSSMKNEVKAAEVPQVVGSSTPGLISLSKPMGGDARATSSKTKKSRAKQGQLVKVDSSDAFPRSSSTADAGVMSTSAPASSHTEGRVFEADGALTWQQQLMSGHSAGKSKSTAGKKGGARLKSADSPANAEASKDTQNWQQSLLNSTSKAKRGPKFDVFADARDAETFGDSRSSELQRSGSIGEDVTRVKVVKKAAAARNTISRGSAASASSSHSKKSGDAQSLPTSDSVGDISVDDVFGNHQPAINMTRSVTAVSKPNAGISNQRNSLPAQPSTPIKRPQSHPSSSPAIIPSTSAHHLLPPASGADAAYAGPDFHNSPSAASLPAPTFKSSRASRTALQMQASASGGRLSTGSVSSSSLSSEEGGHGKSAEVSASSSVRSLRGGTGAAAAHYSSSPNRQSDSDQISPGNEQQSAPAMGQANKSTTIENLLARMMG